MLSVLELQAGIERWESYVSAHEKTLRDTLDDEIKLAGLEALVPQELEKHSMLNPKCLRTFGDARLEVVKCVEAKFGLRIRDSKPRETGTRGHSDPLDVEEKGHQLQGIFVSSAVETIYNYTAIFTSRRGKAMAREANRASLGPRVPAKERAQKVRDTENLEDNPEVPRVLKIRVIVKVRNLVQVKKHRGEDDPGHRSCSEHISTTLWFR